MNINTQTIAKTNIFLEDALTNSKDNKILKVIMSLQDDENIKTILGNIKPDQFPNYREYRQALIDTRKKQLQEGIVAQTIKELQDLSLTTHGGDISNVVIVEGTASQILAALQLPGVKSASLDQVFYLNPTPFPEETFTNIANIISELISAPSEIINRASEQYVRKYYQQNGRLQVLGMRNPVNLRDIYTTVQFLSQWDIKDFATEATFENKKTNHHDKERKNGLEVANQEARLMVLGAPGSGKSTFLRKVGLEALYGNENEYQPNYLPVFLELKRFTQSEVNIQEKISQEFADCGFANPNELTENALNKGKLLILLDGLDEVNSQFKNQVIDNIEKFVEKYSENRFMISCRVADYKHKFKAFKEVEIADFDDIQIQQFINNWFQSKLDQERKTADKCWQILQSNEGIKELAHTPLLLTLIFLVYDRSQLIPRNRSTLYQKALRILLEEWAAEKRLQLNAIYQGLDANLEEILLAEIAYQQFRENKLFFDKQTLINYIKNFLINNLNAPENLDGEMVLNAMTVQQGILVERLDNVYSFSHLTLQEYLTAKYIIDHNLIADLVNKYVTQTRWQEVFLLVAGLMPAGADNLLLLMEQKALNYLQTSTGKNRLIPWFNWAENITKNSEATLPDVAKRSVAIAIANANVIPNANAIAYAYDYDYAIVYANANANAIAHANANTNANSIAYANANANFIAYAYAIAYANAYAIAHANNAINEMLKSLNELNKLPPIFNHQVNLDDSIQKLNYLRVIIPNDQQSQEDKVEFAKKLKSALLEIFCLQEEMINLSREEVQEIDREYFYIYWLMLQCKEAAVMVSRHSWQEIEERMFRANPAG